MYIIYHNILPLSKMYHRSIHSDLSLNLNWNQWEMKNLYYMYVYYPRVFNDITDRTIPLLTTSATVFGGFVG